MFQSKRVALDQMPDTSAETLRRLSNEDLIAFQAGWKPGSANHIKAEVERGRRQGRTNMWAMIITTLVAIISLGFSLLGS